MVFNLTKNGIASDQKCTPVLNSLLKSFSKSLLLQDVPDGTENQPFARKTVPLIQDKVHLVNVRASVHLVEASSTRDMAPGLSGAVRLRSFDTAQNQDLL